MPPRKHPRTLDEAPLGSREPKTSTPPVQASGSSWTSSIVQASGSRTGSFHALVDDAVPPHTLILGTQPSEVSLGCGWYFGKDENAFWHLIGCGLGFRRGFHIGRNQVERGDVIASYAKFLPPKESEDVVTTYEEAVRRLLGAGYALWDICESSERKNKSGKKTSMDADISKLVPAPIEELVEAYPSIRRLVFATGKGSAKIFRDKFGDWLRRGHFCCGNDAAFEVFNEKKGMRIPRKSMLLATTEDKQGGSTKRKAEALETRLIELVVPPSVSPAACRFAGERDFGEKRAGWLQHVFEVADS